MTFRLHCHFDGGECGHIEAPSFVQAIKLARIMADDPRMLFYGDSRLRYTNCRTFAIDRVDENGTAIPLFD